MSNEVFINTRNNDDDLNKVDVSESLDTQPTQEDIVELERLFNSGLLNLKDETGIT